MSARKITRARVIVTAMTLVATSLTASVCSADDSVGTMGTTTAATEAATTADSDAKPVHHHHHHEEPKADTSKAADAPEAVKPAPAPAPEPAKAVTPPTVITAPLAAASASIATTDATPLQLRETHPIALAPEPPAYAAWKLAGILALMGAGAFFLKRRQAQRRPAETIRSLQVLKKLSIGVRTELLVVDVDGQRLLLGVTPNSIQTLAALPDLDAAASEEMESRAATTFRPERALGEKSNGLGDRLAALVERSRTSDSDALADTRNDLRTTARPQRSSTSKRPASATEALEGQARGLADLRENVPRDSRGLADLRKIGRVG